MSTRNIQIKCLFCKKSFNRYISQTKEKTFCSKECAYAHAKNDPNWASWNRGIERSNETLERLSIAHKGQKPWNTGIVGSKSGEKNGNWIKDRTKLKRFNDDSKDRRSSAYGVWRKQVWLRDNFKCKIANPDCCGRIEAHHILSWREYPELRYETNNGITLCHAHHPRKRAEEKRLIPTFQELVTVSEVLN